MGSTTVSKCLLCRNCSDTEEVEKVLPNNDRSCFRKIVNVCSIYLKSTLESTGKNLTCLTEKSDLFSYEFCSSCFIAGLRLSELSDRFKTIQYEIDDLVNELSTKILTTENDHPEKLTRQELSTITAHVSTTTGMNLNDVLEELAIEEIKNETDVKDEINEDFEDAFSDIDFGHCEYTSQPQINSDTEENELNQDESITSNNISSEGDCRIELSRSNQSEHNETTKERSILQSKTIDIAKMLEKIKSTSLVVSLSRLSLTKSNQENPTNNIKMTEETKYPGARHKRKRKSLKDTSKDEASNPLSQNKGIFNGMKRLGMFSNEDDEETFYENANDSVSENHPKRIQSRKATIKPAFVQSSIKPSYSDAIITSCNECNKIFISKMTYDSHMNKHHKTEPVKCTKCDDIFPSKKSLQDHLKSVHPDKTFVCEHCPATKTFSERYDYEIHVMTHTGEIPFECQQCHKKFSNVRLYCKHQKLSTNCGKSYGKFKCENCSKDFKAKFLLLSHNLQAHEKVKKWKSKAACEICATSFTNLHELEYHYSSVHTEESIYYCDICGDNFASINVLQTHRITHLGKAKIDCSLCKKSFANHYRLKKHIYLKHREFKEHQITCENCGKKFSYQHERDYHFKKCGQPDRHFTCETCGKTFTKSISFKDHLRTHKGQLYTCTMCEKQFSSRGGLRLHLKAKHFEKERSKYMCEMCGNVYATKNAYVTHQKKKHLGEFFECKICGEKFEQPAKLWDHRRVVHFGKTRKCRFCDKTFSTHSKLGSHETSKHLDQLGKKFECKVCGMCFDKPSLKLAHRRLQHSELMTSKAIPNCETCNLTFSSLQAFQKHSKRHDKCGNVIVKCKVCEKDFLGGRGLKLHLDVVHKFTSTQIQKMFSAGTYYI